MQSLQNRNISVCIYEEGFNRMSKDFVRVVKVKARTSDESNLLARQITDDLVTTFYHTKK